MWKWTTKKISYVGVLIATSVVFILIGSMIFAITAYPSFKISFAGLPVKLTGYLFGPLIGAITGFLTDIISFIFLPTFYHPGYSLTMAVTGMIPGIVMWIMIRNPRNIHVHFFATLGVFLILWGFMFWFFWTLPDNIIQSSQNIITVRWLYLLIGVGGTTFNIVLLIFLRFFMKHSNFIQMAPIMMATAILGTTTSFMLPLWDLYVLNIPYMVNLVTHYLVLLPIKFIFDITVVYIAWKVISPLVDKSTQISWTDDPRISDKKNNKNVKFKYERSKQI